MDLLIALWNPLSVVSGRHQRQVRSDELRISSTLFVYASIFWAVAYLGFAYLTDTKKHNFEAWEAYRVAFASTLIINVLLLKIVFTKWPSYLRIASVLNAVITSYLVSFSMIFGQKIRAEWIFYFPLLFLVVGIRNYFLAAAILTAAIVLEKGLWSNQHSDQVMITTCVLGILILGIAQILTKFWAEFRNLELSHRETVANSIQEKIEFQRQMKRYIPSALMARIEKDISSGKTLAAALDDIERMRVQKVAILYSDLIDYSKISDSQSQVKIKLIGPVERFVNRIAASGAVARTIGDGLFCFYEKQDPEEALLTAIADACFCSIEEINSREAEGATTRYFTVGYGSCQIGKIGGSDQVEISIHGSPANETNRIDRISHTPEFSEIYRGKKLILLSNEAANLFETFSKTVVVQPLAFDLEVKGISSKSVYSFEMSKPNIDALNELLILNNLKHLTISENLKWLKELQLQQVA
ncbi:MAG: adenylate/guanylate cyclase domain-containing protein [Cryobacterium sp.]|nr:adenylate/guanylate cyclase domain-containing protein [Oligoflexia bacterium]